MPWSGAAPRLLIQGSDAPAVGAMEEEGGAPAHLQLASLNPDCMVPPLQLLLLAPGLDWAKVHEAPRWHKLAAHVISVAIRARALQGKMRSWANFLRT